MTSIFLDTVGLIALWNQNDQWHAPATAAFQALSPGAARLVSTSEVLMECANAAARRPYRIEVVQLRDDLRLAGDLIQPTSDEIEQAWAEYAVGAIGSAGVVDLLSFAVMRRLRIRQAFTNDAHFSAAGFEVMF